MKRNAKLVLTAIFAAVIVATLFIVPLQCIHAKDSCEAGENIEITDTLSVDSVATVKPVVFHKGYKPVKEEFLNACDSLKISNGNVVWAQARLESGNFTSSVYKSKNNCLGLYDSRNRCYMHFDSWVHCLIAYRDKVQYKCKLCNASDTEYLAWVCDSGYAEDSTYYSKVHQILKSNK